MSKIIPITEARDKFLPILENIRCEKSTYLLTKHGRPHAVILSVEEFESMKRKIASHPSEAIKSLKR